MNTWRAGCSGSCTSGSEGGPGKPTSRKADRAPRSDPYTEHPTRQAQGVLRGGAGRVRAAGSSAGRSTTRPPPDWSPPRWEWQSGTASPIPARLYIRTRAPNSPPGRSPNGPTTPGWYRPSVTVGDCFDNATMASFLGSYASRAVGPQTVEDPDRTRQRYLRVPGGLPQPPAAPHCTGHAHPHRIRENTLRRQPNRHSTDPSELTPQNQGTISPPHRNNPKPRKAICKS